MPARYIPEFSPSRRLLSMLTGLLVLSLHVESLAQPMGPCLQHPESRYCDPSWKGARDFMQSIQNPSRTIYLERNLREHDENAHPAHPGDVFIGISTRSISPAAIDDALNAGAHVVLFDETDISRQIYEHFIRTITPAIFAPSPGEAWLINANPALPVHTLPVAFQERIVIPVRPRQIAWNHPTPLYADDPVASPRPILIVHVPPKTLSPTSGSLTIIRDESFPTRLMLQTLDNRAFIQDLFDTLCHNADPCHLRMMDENSAFALKTNSTLSATQTQNPESIFDEFPSVTDAIKWLHTQWNTIEEQSIRRIVLAAFTLWMFLITFILIPIRRVKP